VASLEHRSGAVTLLLPAGEGAETALPAGTVVVAGADGSAALRLAAGAAVRVDAGSRLRLTTARSLALERGAVYVDSGGAGGAARPIAPGLEVVTPLGRVTDVGTQFEVRLTGEGAAATGLRLRVREGEARLAVETATHPAAAGEEIALDVAGRVARGSVAPDDAGWRWAAAAAPALPIEGQTLAAFLDRATRELGLSWRLVEPLPGEDPARVVLHGSGEGLTPEEALEVVLAGSALRGERVGAELRVSAAPAPAAAAD
jgi:hypothetical protein